GTVPYENKRREWTSPVFAEITGTDQAPVVTDDRFHTGKVGDALLDANYFPISKALIERGRDRFEVNCMPCHGLLGNGDGVVVRRGFPQPPSYHIPRLLEVEEGHFFDVITRGFGRMYSYASRVAPEDRWAIAAYIRALQLSQNVNLESLPAAERQRIQEAVQAASQREEASHVH
ncbi:MAG TPA: cytochrome c, partial [Candidatus Hydrogenedentes bacterium]|nr:cytochrome c [Candidatus Hydrogenedentota bacterium]